MDTLTKSKTTVVEAVLADAGYPRLSLSHDKGRFTASTYFPNGDVAKDVGCYGSGNSLAEALAGLAKEWEKAEAAGRKLRTAAECKAAVIDLMREHDAAPAAFRDAVDQLNVA